jgi:hypothetical protein
MDNLELGKQHELAEAQAKVEAFFRSFDNRELITTEGKGIKLKLRRSERKIHPNLPESERPYILEFEGFPGEPKKKERQQNYIRFKPDFAMKRIEIDNTCLTSPELKSKGVYSQIRKMIADNFPEGFTLTSLIINPRTEKQMLSVKYRLNKNEITREEARSELFNNYWVQEWIRAGFNKIQIQFDDSFLWETVFLNRSKSPDGKLDFSAEWWGSEMLWRLEMGPKSKLSSLSEHAEETSVAELTPRIKPEFVREKPGQGFNLIQRTFEELERTREVPRYGMVARRQDVDLKTIKERIFESVITEIQKQYIFNSTGEEKLQFMRLLDEQVESDKMVFPLE